MPCPVGHSDTLTDTGAVIGGRSRRRRGSAVRPHPRPDETVLPSTKLRAARLLVDCNSFGARGIEMAVAVYGADKIVCGSDGTGFGKPYDQSALREKTPAATYIYCSASRIARRPAR